METVNIHAVHLHPNRENSNFTFTLQEEKETSLLLAEQVGNFLYEPHAALLKSGAFKLIAHRYGLRKLHRHTHLYTSEELVKDFPGRSFQVEKVLKFSGKLLKQVTRQLPKANLTIRNFPLSVAEFRKRSGLKEGGDHYLFATTIAKEERVILQTIPITMIPAKIES